MGLSNTNSVYHTYEAFFRISFNEIGTLDGLLKQALIDAIKSVSPSQYFILASIPISIQHGDIEVQDKLVFCLPLLQNLFIERRVKLAV